MMISCKPYSQVHHPFFEQVVQDSPAWQEEESSVSDLHIYIKKYDMMNGHWKVWMDNGNPIGITFTADWVPSNEKPWIGTVLVDGQARRKGYGKQMVAKIAEGYKKQGYDALFAAVPLQRTEWMQFLAACGFEQFKVEESDQHISYMIMVKPLS
jgi:GNAT superfamily N-acetyltransferase